jgi:hypothetical protein
VGKRTDWMVLFYVGCISIVDILDLLLADKVRYSSEFNMAFPRASADSIQLSLSTPSASD